MTFSIEKILVNHWIPYAETDSKIFAERICKMLVDEGEVVRISERTVSVDVGPPQFLPTGTGVCGD